MASMGGLHLPTDEGMFRRAAIEERALAAEPTPVLEVSPPWTWAATLVVVAALVLGAWALLRVPVPAAGGGGSARRTLADLVFEPARPRPR